jgi:hypothetical protein
MSAWPRTYRYLAALDDAAVDEALAAGTRELDGPYLRFAAEVLLERARPEGLPAVIDCYHRLPADLKARVVSSSAVISPVLRTSIRSHDVQGRLNCLEIASRIGGEALAYLFDLGLMDGSPEVRGVAASTLRQAARRLLGEHPLLGVDPAAAPLGSDRPLASSGQVLQTETEPARLALRRGQLFEALLSGAQRYESHLRREVVEACLWFEPYLGSRLWELVEQPRSRLRRVLSDLLISSDEPQAACFLPQAMAVQAMRSYAIRALRDRRDPRWFRSVLRGAQLWHPWPRVRRAWSHIKKIGYLDALDDASWAELGLQESLAILIAASNIGIEKKTDLFERLLNSGTSPSCRRQILLEACRARDWGAGLLRAVVQQSTDPAEVRMAAYGLLEANCEALAGDLVKRLCSADDTAADDLLGLVADLVFWRLWTRFDSMQEERRVAALAGVKGFAGYLRNRLRVNLAAASASSRVRAVRMTGLLGLADALWRDMLLAAQDPAGRVRSAAVQFLGCSGRSELRQQLRAALDDEDSRVQANAIETVEKAQWPDRVQLIAPKLDSDNNRVRGNAALALVRAGDDRGAGVLTEMLGDSRDEQRITAIWAIRQIGGGAWLDRLAELAEGDPAETVRRLAQSVHKDLQQAQGATVHPGDSAAARFATEKDAHNEAAVATGQE